MLHSVGIEGGTCQLTPAPSVRSLHLISVQGRERERAELVIRAKRAGSTLPLGYISTQLIPSAGSPVCYINLLRAAAAYLRGLHLPLSL